MNRTIKALSISLAGALFISIFSGFTFMNLRIKADENDLSAEEMLSAAEYVEGEFIVTYGSSSDAATSAEQTEEGIMTESLDSIEAVDVYEETVCVSLEDGEDMVDAMEEWMEKDGVIAVQPNYIYYPLNTSENITSTNDPEYSSLYHLDRINAPEAWDVMANRSTLSPVRVAVIDTRVDVEHEDLNGKFDLDDSRNCTDAFFSKINTNGSKAYLHGSHVAGIIGAISDNEIGICGVATGYDNDYLEMINLQVFATNEMNQDYSDTYILTRAIQMAMYFDVDVINMSLGGSTYDAILDAKIQAALDQGITIIASAGNSNVTTPMYPAAFSGVISVIATTKEVYNGLPNRTSFSNYGSTCDICAPGENILSIYRELKNTGYTSYSELSGTSMAAPIVTAVAAMMLAVNPDLTPAEIEEIIYSTATDLDAEGRDDETGYGEINAYLAVAEAASRYVEPEPTETPTIPTPTPEEVSPLEAFVTRMYTKALNRNGEADGIADWTSKLENHELAGDDIALGFFLSSEFINQNLSDEQFVTTLYRTLFDRQPDSDGYQGWLAYLSQGNSRESVILGFTGSPEFIDLCNSFGIDATSGDVLGAERQIENFVERMYTKCLYRAAESQGKADWTDKLVRGEISGRDMAYGFIFSAEYKAKNATDGQFICMLYITLMDRSYDQQGFDNWMNALAMGATREEVFEGFINSVEFENLCSQYGISVR